MFKGGKEHIYILNKNEFNIRIYDKNGNFSHAMEKDFPLVEITDNDKELLFNYYKFQVKDFLRLKPRLVIPKYYPAIYDFTEFDNKLYLLTWKVVEKKREILVVDLNGKILLKSFITHKGIHVYIYSLTNFKLKKKFGRLGEGPQEFKNWIIFECFMWLTTKFIS